MSVSATVRALFVAVFAVVAVAVGRGRASIGEQGRRRRSSIL